MISASTPFHPVLARYADLQSLGILNLMRAGRMPEVRTLESQVTRLFQEGRVDLFIRAHDPHPFLSPLPHRLTLPPTLALQGRWAEEPRINVGHSPLQAYVHVSRIVSTETEIPEDALEASTHQLNSGAAAMISAAPIEQGGGPMMFTAKGGAYVIAARDRGDTHLLVQLRPSVTQTGTRPPTLDLPVVGLKDAPTRAAFLRRLIKNWERLNPAEVLGALAAGSTHPALLRDLHRLAELDRHPQAVRALLFLQMICRTGFARAGVAFPPAECPVAVVGFGEEFETIRVLLDHGYPVIAVEDFETKNSTSGQPDITFDSVRDTFQDHLHRNRLQVFDFRDPGLPHAEAQVVLFAAVVDEALPTLVHLVRPGGIIAVTDVGQLGWRRQNFFVDTADAFIHFAGLHHAARFSKIHSDTLHGPGALRSHFIHPFGHNAYIVRRED